MSEPTQTACLQAEQISAFLDGDLDQTESEATAVHLEQCPDCRATRDEMTALMGGLAALAEVEVPARVWGEIQRAHHAADRVPLIERLRRAWAVPAWTFAGAAVVVAVWVWQAPPAEQAKPTGLAAALHSVRRAEDTYIEAIAALQQVADQDLDHFDPRVRTTIKQGLAAIDSTIENCRRALHESPGDITAHRTMLAAYQQKVDFLNELLAHVPEKG